MGCSASKAVLQALKQRFARESSVVVKRPRIRHGGRHRQYMLLSDLSPELAGLGVACGFAGKTTNLDHRYTAKMRIPVCSAAICRQISPNASARIWRPQLGSRVALRNARYNSSGMCLSCDNCLAWSNCLVLGEDAKYLTTKMQEYFSKTI